jgi:release factor glutamine methyltransferase
MYPVTTQEEILIISAITKKPIEKLYTEKEIKLSAVQQKKFKQLRDKLKRGWPLAYLTGSRWFYRHEFEVNPDVLIPRPETEILVERALEYAKQSKPNLIADIGTGSGAIIISLYAELKDSEAKFFATDISSKALGTAKKNSKKIIKSKKIGFIRGNLAAPILPEIGKSKNVLICANLPYLAKKQLHEPSIKHEPGLALDGGKESTTKIENLLKQLSKQNLRKYCILLEIDPNQTKDILKFTKNYFPDCEAEVFKDLAGLDRIVELRGNL